MNSLMAVEVRNRLGKQTGLSVPATLVFDHPNLKAVSEWVLEALELADSSSKVETAAVVRHVEATGALAIIGVGLRFPGCAVDLESFWQVLSTGVDTLGPIPPERFGSTSYYDPDPEHRGTSYIEEGGIVLERCGGIRRSFLRNLATGSGADGPAASAVARSNVVSARRCRDRAEVAGKVDDGIVHWYWAERISQPRFEAGGRRRLCSDGRRGVILCGRLAYHLGVHGPVMAVDTACSSSLVALHLGSEHLRSGRCDLAIVGGVQVASSAKESFVLLSQTRALASDGRSKTFSEAADGYGRGEGAAVLVMMRLEDAQAQGRRIVGVVRGTAVDRDRCEFGHHRAKWNFATESTASSIGGRAFGCG